MKKYTGIILSLFLSLIVVSPARADEGMWLPSLISQRIGDMQAKGFKLTAEDIYSVNQASMKDAIVLFGSGCTGEIVSAEGLLLTNHHCGYSQIQKHSSVEHDYLRDGFWAMTREEELPNEGLTVRFLERMDDVTSVILKGYKESMTEDERVELVSANSKALIDQVTDKEKGISAAVEALYYGNQYFLFIYKTYRDIRLVGAPPSSIGKFGGDTDNWMWPRHTGDFSIFRIYADKNNNPADYSEDNVPYTPKKFFKISRQGVKEGDFTMIYGFPGSTQEYIMSEGVRYISEVSDPHKIALRTKRLDIQNKYMSQSQAVRIQYSSKNASVSNAWKKWQGEQKGLDRLGTVKQKQEYEKAFIEWAKGSEYEGVVEKLGELYNIRSKFYFPVEYYNESIGAIEIIGFARNLLSNDRYKTADLSKFVEQYYKDYYMPIDKEIFVALVDAFEANVPAEFKPSYFKETLASFDGSASKWADYLFENSIFARPQELASLSPTDSLRIINDPASQLAKAFTGEFAQLTGPTVSRVNRELQLANRDYMRGQMEFEKDKVFYPDANLTLRVAYGKVQGYTPADGVYYFPVSTAKGIIEKDDPDVFDYNIPQAYRDMLAEGNNDDTPVCFLATNHTSGGNSGSPIINAEGNLIGINFDRVWEGTMSDIDFDPDLCRNISLDIRYLLFIVEHLGGATHLLEEMSFVD